MNYKDIVERRNILLESILFTKKDLYLNFDKYEYNVYNFCLITGLSGSGKSTLGMQLARRSRANYIELDLFSKMNKFKDDEDIKKYAGMLFYDYFKEHRDIQEKLIKGIAFGKEFENAYLDFMRYSVDYAKTHPEERFIIEGVQIYHWMDKELKDYPVIIKNTSAVRSFIQMLKRDTETDNIIKAFYKEDAFLPGLFKWYIEDEMNLNKFRKFIKESGC